MKVLVTGGSGFLGTHIRQFFNADDFSRRSSFDVLNLNDAAMVADYDVVIHLAAVLEKSPQAAESCFLTNVEGTVNVLRHVAPDAAFIFASTKDVYGAAADDFVEVPELCATDFSGQSALEWSKLIAERYVEFYAHTRGFRSCIFRLSTVYAAASSNNEPNFVSHYIEALNLGERLSLPANGEPRRDLLHVTDFARACQAFVDSDVRHGLYNLGGGIENAVTLLELIKLIEKLTGAQATISSEPAPAPIPFNYVSDLSKIKRELNWQPTIGLEEGLRSLL